MSRSILCQTLRQIVFSRLVAGIQLLLHIFPAQGQQHGIFLPTFINLNTINIKCWNNLPRARESHNLEKLNINFKLYFLAENSDKIEWFCLASLSCFVCSSQWQHYICWLGCFVYVQLSHPIEDNHGPMMYIIFRAFDDQQSLVF